MKGKKANAFFWVYIIMMVLLFVVVIIVQISRDSNSFNHKIGYVSLKVLNAMEKGQVLSFYIDTAADTALRETVTDLGRKGGVQSDACGTYKGYKLWNSENSECFPDKETIDIAISEEFEKKFNGLLEQYPDGDLPDVGFEYQFTALDGGILELKGTAEKDIQIEISTSDDTNMESGTMTRYKGSGNVEDIVFGSDECHYCGDMRDYLQRNNPDAYAECGGARCCKAACPPGSKIIDGPYYNQCSFGIDGFCENACGPTSLKIALESTTHPTQDIQKIWDNGDCSIGEGCVLSSFWGIYGCDIDGCIKPVLTSPTYDTIEEEIDAGHPMILLTTMSSYADQACIEGGGHFHVIVGYSDDYIIINDPYTKSAACPTLDVGEHIVLEKDYYRNALTEYTGYTARVKAP